MSDRWLQFLRDPDRWAPPDPLPGPVRTARTVVRLWQSADGPLLFEAVTANRQALLPWMAWASTDHERVEHSVFYVEKVRREAQEPSCRGYFMAILDRGEREVLGGTGFQAIDAATRTAEIGYWVRGDRQGRGLCTEAIGALMTAGFAPTAAGGWGFRRIVIDCSADNHGSRRVVEKLGLRRERHARRDRWVDPELGGNGYHDTLGYALLADEWDPAAHRARA